MNDDNELSDLPPNAIAVVGAAVHAPGAVDRASLWEQLVSGAVLSESVSDEQLRERGVSERLLSHPRYVKRCLRLPNLREFEPEFFGLTPRDAALIDPQLRHLFECTWEALEDAAIDPARPSGPIGLFVGVGPSEYLLHNLMSDRELVDTHGIDKLLQLGNDRDYVAARIAYALDLRGPTSSVSAACASGALAVHSAVQSLLGRECRIALAAAASIVLPDGTGYMFEAGGLNAPDGVCRSFDERAEGTLPSSAAAVVTLMRLDDAVREGRAIYATILATAYNNDGHRKVGFAAPSVDGPLSAIEEALAVAGIDARSIGYVEAHGTGTAFGDSIEVSALTQVFRQTTEDVGFCVLGSNKPNLGHTDAASGLISLIKAASALAAGTLPPLANFRAPHPLLELASSPFRILTQPAAWSSDQPRRALVNCLSVGGTNVHLVLEEAPRGTPLAGQASPVAQPELFVLSARSSDALRALQLRLAKHLELRPELSLRDVAYTLRAGRHVFEHRKAVVVSSHEDALAQLRGEPATDVSATPLLVRLLELGRRFLEEREPTLGLDDAASEPARFVHLPCYPFERRSFWMEPRAHALPTQTQSLPLLTHDSLPHARVSFGETRPSLTQPEAGQRWLVFVDETGFGERVLLQLRALGCEVITARLGHGPALARVAHDDYRIDCDRGFEGPATLIAELAREVRLPDVILHLWTVTTDERFRSATNRFHHDMERGYFTVLALCQALATLDSTHPMRIVAVTNDALSAGDERVEFPAKTLIFGPISTLSLEQPNITALAIDINIPVGLKRALIVPQLLDRSHDKAVAALLPEAVGRTAGIYALRGRTVYTRTLESVPRPESKHASAVRPGGTYIVLGGFGNLGYAIAGQLAARAKLKLVLLGRTPVPERAYWADWLRDHAEDDPVSQRIHKLQALEQAGAEVLALAGDICHFESMSSALSLVRRRFGAVHGVVHAAGVLSEALAGSESLDEARDALAPEVLGTRVLEEVLQHEELDFFVLLGSAARHAPRPGTYARAAASEFAEGFSNLDHSLHARAFDLGLVRDGGMYASWARDREAEGPVTDPQVRGLIAEIEGGMSTQLAAGAIVDALASHERQLVIGRVPAAGAPLRGGAGSFARSELKRTFVAPEGELERKLAGLWADVLRIDRVGATDDFFELGGHSLIAVRLTARIKALWGVTVPLALLIEAPTVRALAHVIGEHLGRRGDNEETHVLREWSTVVPLQPRGDRPPLFCVGGKGGNVMNLRHLATLLGRDQPVFGLQARGVDGTQRPHETLEAMVEEYLRDVQRVRAKGPYFLSGFSGGGAMILEMARKLRSQGHTVGPLLFFDAWNPAAPERRLDEKLRAHAGLFRELGPRYAKLYTERVVATRAQHLLRSVAPALADRLWEAAPPLGEVADAWDAAAAHYSPAPYEGEAVLFRVRADRSRGELDWSEDEQNGWGGVVLGGIEIIDVPGTHTSIVEEPHVRTLAQSVRAVIDRAVRTLEQGERDSVRPGRPSERAQASDYEQT